MSVSTLPSTYVVKKGYNMLRGTYTPYDIQCAVMCYNLLQDTAEYVTDMVAILEAGEALQVLGGAQLLKVATLVYGTQRPAPETLQQVNSSVIQALVLVTPTAVAPMWCYLEHKPGAYEVGKLN